MSWPSFQTAKEKAKKAAHNINGQYPDEQYEGRQHRPKHQTQKYGSQDPTGEGDRRLTGSESESIALQASRQTSSRKDVPVKSDRYLPGPPPLPSQQQQQRQEAAHSSHSRPGVQQQSSYFSDHDYRHPDPREVIENLQDRLKDRKQEIDKLNTKNLALLRENEKLGDELLVLQERSFSALTDARLMPLDMNTINGEIENVRDTIWGLAKLYAAESFAGIAAASEDEQIAFRLSVEHVVRFSREGAKCIGELAAIRHAPRLLLAAMISDSVHKDVLSSPFFLLDDGLDRRFESLRQVPKYERMRLRPSPPQVVSHIFEGISQYNPNEAQKWRSDTLRLMYPSHVDTDSARNTLQNGRKAIDEAAGHFAAQTLQDMPPALLRPLEEASRQQFLSELTEVYASAGRLSIRLWSQRPALECRVLSKLAHISFDVSSSILKAHQLHKLDDPSDHSFDGKSTKILVHPAIMTLGTHEADHYDRAQVLVKAVVWLDVEKATFCGGLLTVK